jgi:cytochrome c-type biogenesis protein CcmE
VTDIERGRADLDDLDDDPGAGHGHDSAAGDGLDLTPRTGPPSGARPARRSRRGGAFAYVFLALIVVAVGVVLLKGLGDATLYFRNVDEAVAERDSLGQRDFRVQGLVTSAAVERGDALDFTVSFNEVDLAVRSIAGPPPDLFGQGQPVVLEGHFLPGDDVVFEAHRILVKHDETYTEDHGDRLREADDGTSGATGSGSTNP